MFVPRLGAGLLDGYLASSQLKPFNELMRFVADCRLEVKVLKLHAPVMTRRHGTLKNVRLLGFLPLRRLAGFR